VEFGLCKQADSTFKVYGAGLLSSVAELQHAITAENKIKKFDPEVTCQEECIITSYQNAYYYTDSFEEAKEQMRCVGYTGNHISNKLNYSLLKELLPRASSGHLECATTRTR